MSTFAKGITEMHCVQQKMGGKDYAWVINLHWSTQL